jgi:prepilin peptidase CpaA
MAYSFICGGIIAIMIMAIRKNAISRFTYFINYLKNSLLTFSFGPYDGTKFRFAIAIFLGVIVQLAMQSEQIF